MSLLEQVTPVDASVCHITVLSVPNPKKSGRLSGFAKRILTEANLVLTNSFNDTLVKFAQRHRAPNVSSLSTYRKLGSEDEMALFDLATREIAKIALSLNEVRVAQVDIGACWALGLRSAIFRELYCVYAINKMLDEKIDRVVVLVSGFGASELAVVARLLELQEEGRIKLQGVCELKNEAIIPYDCSAIQAARKVLVHRRSENNFSVEPATKERMVGLPDSISGDRPEQADTVFLHFTDNPMFQRNILPVIRAVKAKQATPAVLIHSGKLLDVYLENLENDKIFQFNPKVEWEDAAMLERLAQQITTRVEVAALDISPSETWTALLASQDTVNMELSLKKLLIFQSAMNLIHGWVKPRSFYITQSPDTNPYAYLALATSRRKSNFYYCFSSLLDEDTRSLPFVAPARLLAYGEHDKAVVGKRNEKTLSSTNIVGVPSYDMTCSLDVAKTKKELRSELKIPSGDKIIVIMTSRKNPEVENVWLARFLRWADSRDIHCILVEGRRSGVNDYTALAAISKRNKWNKTHFIHEEKTKAIACADIIVTDSTKAVVEAALLDKIIVCMRPKGMFYRAEKKFDKVGVKVDTELDLQEVVGGIMTNEKPYRDKMKEAVKDFKKFVNGGSDGTASDKTANYLLGTTIRELDCDNPFTENLILSKASIVAQHIITPANFLL